MARNGGTAGVIAFPPLIYGVAFAASVAAERLLQTRPLPRAVRPLSIGCFLAAATLVAPAFREFTKAGTAVDPFEETTALVTSGPYEHTRNPIYLGLTLAYAGTAFALRRRLPLLVLPPLVWMMNAGVIEREERYLDGKFGAAYREYKQRIPRWL